MAIYIVIGLGLLMVVNLLMLLGLAGYHLGVTANQARNANEGLYQPNAARPEFERPAGEIRRQLPA